MKKIFEMRLNFNLKNAVLLFLVVFFGLAFFLSFQKANELYPDKPLSSVLVDLKEGKVQKIEVLDSRLLLTYKDESLFTTHKEPQQSLVEILKDAGVSPAEVEIEIKDTDSVFAFWNIIGNVLPVVLMVAFFLFLFRQARGAQDSIFSFGRSKAKLFSKKMTQVTFQDVAGVNEAKKELEEVVDFLKHSKKYQALGARTPKGVLLIGPSGTGKTLLARALAGEAKVPFFSMAGSEFMEMLVGVGASVTGETPVLIRKNGEVKLMPIGKFIDQFYKKRETDKVKKIKDVETLGFEKAKNKFWGSKSTKSKKAVFEKSSWKKVEGVYRHQVKEIYEIHFLGGMIQTTGDHSVFVRTHGWILPKRVSELKAGDILVNLPMNVRRWDERQRKTVHKIKKHQFSEIKPLFLDVWNDNPQTWRNYEYVTVNPNHLFQYQLAEKVGVCQMTIGNWQRSVHFPRAVSKKQVKLDLPEKVEVTPKLMKLLGLYTAEGRGTNSLEFTFGAHEEDLILKTAELMNEVFGIEKPVLEKTESNSIRVKYYSRHLGRFFAKICGNGSHNKHTPEFIWDLPKEYFLAYLEGYTKGDGYITKLGKLCASSVSRQLIYELVWLCSMHGIKAGIKHEVIKGGRVIRNKPLPDSEAWTLIIGKTSNPFLGKKVKWPYQIKKCYVRKVVKKKFNGFVYDLCGVKNEAFFGGEKPILLHNSRVRDLFGTAKKTAPAIIFIDEIESIGRSRSMIGMSSHGEREQTLNQILVEMDGFDPNENVLVIAATNRPDLLDVALIRPGRFDRRIVLDLPDIEGRKEILKIHARGKPFDKTVNWDKVAKRTVGFSGADLENMLNEAAILAAGEGKTEIDMNDLEEAATKVKLGPEKKRLQSDFDKKITAYHEAGHAIITHELPHMDPVHRVSIVSRGMALGFTLIPPQKDRLHETRSHLLEQITTMMGGRAAEELVFNEVTSGAAADFDQATRVARSMVVEYGMSDLGPINFGPTVQMLELGRSFYEQAQISQEMQAKIDKEIKKIIDQGYQNAKKILSTRRDKLDLTAKELIKKESLDGDEFEKLIGYVKKKTPSSVIE